jgi:hypothetical protein
MNAKCKIISLICVSSSICSPQLIKSFSTFPHQLFPMKTYFLAIIVYLLSLSSFAQQFTESNLPIVLLNTDGMAIPNEPKIPAIMKIIDNGPGQINHITDPANVYDGNIGIEIRGASSAYYPQKPYAVETRDAQQDDLKVSLFGWPEESDWVLLANYNDKVFMRNVLAFKLFNEMGFYASRTRFVEVMLNGQYDGIYIFGEKIKRDEGRVDIARLDPDEINGEPLTGGYIFKVDYYTPDDSWLSPYHPIDHPDFDINFVYYYPKPEDIAPEQKEYIKTYVTAFEAALYSPDFCDPVLGYKPFINSESFVAYSLVNELARNNDGFKKSYYFNKNRDGIDKRINSGPVWDFDWAWKNINECSIFANTDGSGWAFMVNNCWPDVNSPGWQVRLVQDPEYVNLTRCRWEQLRQDILNKDSLLTWIDANTSYLWEAQQRHYMRWPILGQNVGTPVLPPIPTTFQGEIDAFKLWIDLRINWLDANIPGICDPTALPEHQIPQVLVFPNPAGQWLFVEAGSANQQIEIYNSSGLITNILAKSDGALVRIDVSELSCGLYVVKVMDLQTQAVSIHKIIIKK